MARELAIKSRDLEQVRIDLGESYRMHDRTKNMLESRGAELDSAQAMN